MIKYLITLLLLSSQAQALELNPRKVEAYDPDTGAHLKINVDGSINIMGGGGTGTCTSVDVSVPSWLTSSGGPITTSGTIAITGTSQAQNLFLASPNGSSGAMTPRTIVAADIPTLNQNTSGSAATVATNANLTGPITSTGNATAIASQTGTGTKFVMDTSPALVTPNIGTATGSASLNLLLAGGTMSGPIVAPTGTTPEFLAAATAGANAVGGDLTIAAGNGTGTGGSGAINFQTAPAAASSSTANTLSTRVIINKLGMSVGGSVPSTGLSSSRTLIVKGQSGSTATGFDLEMENSTAFAGFDLYTTGNAFEMHSGTDTVFTLGLASIYMSFGYHPTGNIYPFTVSHSSTATNPSSMTFGSGALIPSFTTHSQNGTAGNFGGFFNADSSKVTNGYLVWYNDVHGSDSHAAIATSAGGTKSEKLIIRNKGQIVHAGTAPAAGTCGTSPAAPTGNDNVFKITSGTGGSSPSCAVTLASPTTTGGSCACRDDTNTATTVVDASVSSSTVTMTTYSRTTGLAANFAASDVFSCLCTFY